jgi:predicted O-methyltransferase YrrM
VTFILPPDVEDYARQHTTGEPPWFATVTDNTQRETAAPQMMTGTLEGRFLHLLVRLLRPMLVVDVGTFTGYSSLSMAEALPPGGRIVTCDVSEEHVAIARRHIAMTPFADRIDVRLGPALDTIAAIDGPVDMAFIDADKTSYAAYWDALLDKLSDRGLIVVDNVLWSGRVVDPSADDDNTRAIRAFNDKVSDDPRVDSVMLTVRDGVTVAWRRSS